MALSIRYLPSVSRSRHSLRNTSMLGPLVSALLPPCAPPAAAFWLMACAAVCSTSELMRGVLYRVPAAAVSACDESRRCCCSDARKPLDPLPFRNLSSSGRSGDAASAWVKGDRMAGGLVISGSRSMLSCGVKGSGSTMCRGKAERIRLRSWMHEGGMASQKLKWYSHRNSGKSCRSTSSTRSVPLYRSLMGSGISVLRR
mmetsp:Transcript_40415/g.79181  ORF Transcript_40415/g.79181 Transcript_40415/m.79181 type:complete len:200 (-) Transcript_40415:1276-1875(-)